MPRVIQLVTPIPGPRSQALTARRQQAVPRGIPATTPIAIVQADNAVITDADGNRLIDFGGGIGVVNAGHRNPGVVQAVREQLDHFTHVCFPVSMYQSYIELAEKLNQLTPGSHSKKSFFVNSGAEAVENAIKAARRFSGRQAIVCFEHGFHGRTYMGMTLTAKVNPYKLGFGPFAPEVYRIPFPYCYRCESGSRARKDSPAPGGAERSPGGPAAVERSGGQCCMATRVYFDQLFAGVVDPASVAAVIMELEVGEGGFIPAPREYIEALARFCKDHGILFIADEIQTGFGRTGKLFACEHYGLVPDLITTAKSLAGGLPLAAVTGRADVLDAAQPGGLGGTYGGNPLACAAALAVIDVMQRENLADQAAKIGDKIRTRFTEWQTRVPQIGDVRGLGAMMAMELVKDRESKEPAKELTGKLQAESLKRGLILLSAGTLGNVIRVLVPLTVEDAVLDEGLEVMGEALAAATS